MVNLFIFIFRSSNYNSLDESLSEAPKRSSAASRKKKKTNRHSDSDLIGSNQARTRVSRSGCTPVSYKEAESDDEEEEEEDETVDVEEDENFQTIEKVMDHRKGKKGAVGMQTYIYEVEKHGDPNTDFDPNDLQQTEMQYLIKWKGLAHLHNTWESEESLKTQKVRLEFLSVFKYYNILLN